MKGWQNPGIEQTDGGSLKAFGFNTIPEIRLTMVDPAVSEKQRKMMGSDLARKRAGQKTRTGMSEAQLEDFARKQKKRGA